MNFIEISPHLSARKAEVALEKYQLQAYKLQDGKFSDSYQCVNWIRYVIFPLSGPSQMHFYTIPSRRFLSLFLDKLRFLIPT